MRSDRPLERHSTISLKKSSDSPRSSLAEPLESVRLEDTSLEERLAGALQCRQGGLRLYTDQVELLAAFDAADFAGKERMLGPRLWAAWRLIVTSAL